MTIRELYEWAKYNDCSNYDIAVKCYDSDGGVQEVWPIGERHLKKRNIEFDVLIKCCEQSLKS